MTMRHLQSSVVPCDTESVIFTVQRVDPDSLSVVGALDAKGAAILIDPVAAFNLDVNDAALEQDVALMLDSQCLYKKTVE